MGRQDRPIYSDGIIGPPCILAGRDSPHGAGVLQSGEVLLALLWAHWPETLSSGAGVGGGL